MTQLDDHLDGLAEALVAAQGRADARRRRLLRASGTGLAALAITGAFVAVPGGSRLDPVERARAAVAPGGGVLHWVVASIHLGPEGGKFSREPADPPETEVWSAASGQPGWRMLQPVDGRPRYCGVQVMVVGDVRKDNPIHGPALIEPEQYAVSRRGTQLYSSYSRAMVVSERPVDVPAGTADGPGMGAGTLPGGDPRDPVLSIRRAFERGALRDAGELVEGGRRLRKLIGEADPTRPAKGYRPRPDQLTYLVDATTSEPVELRTRRWGVWSRAGGYRHMKWTTSIERFSKFERLADTPEHRKLLQIQPPPGTKIVRIKRDEDPRRHLPFLRAVRQTATKAAVERCEAARDRKP